MTLTLESPPPEAHLLMATPPDDRLVELVRGLTDCSATDAAWSVEEARTEDAEDTDPLTTVARAVVLLRRRRDHD